MQRLRINTGSSKAEHLAYDVKEWRGKVPARIAAEVLGISKRTLDGIEQGRGFTYEKLLRIAMETMPLEEKK
jgi:hypothetical protein